MMYVIPGERYLLIFVLKAAAWLLRDPLEIHDLKSLLMAAQFYELPCFLVANSGENLCYFNIEEKKCH